MQQIVINETMQYYTINVRVSNFLCQLRHVVSLKTAVMGIPLDGIRQKPAPLCLLPGESS